MADRSTNSLTNLALVGRCIYCGAARYTEDGPRARLGDEHIIPEAINGSLVLPEASCQRCERSINKAESHLLSTTLMPVRAYLEMRSKSPSKRPSRLPVYDDSEKPPRCVMVNAEDYPACLFLPVFPPARGLARVPWRPNVVLPPFFCYLRDTVNEVRAKYGVHSVSPPMLGVHHLCRMLAKIAHGFGVIKFDLANLDFLLRPLILGTEQDPFWFIGCDPYQPAVDHLHQVDLQAQEYGGGILITARIRLFARYGAPIYRVVVGRPNALTPPIELPDKLPELER
jgi:hypothetical protein